MTSKHRSSSLGAVPHVKPLARSRAQSSAASPLEVRCACQFFQSDSLIPERINPIGTITSRAPSRLDEHYRSVNCSSQNIIEEEDLNGSVLSFGKVSVPDYYAETNQSPVRSIEQAINHPQLTPTQFNQAFNRSREPSHNKENSLPPSTLYNNNNHTVQNQPLSFEGRNIPSIEIETFRRDFPSTQNVYRVEEKGKEPEEIEVEIEENNNNIEFHGRSMERNLKRETRELSQPVTMMRNQFSSQKSLDRYSNSVLLNRYRPQSQSQSHAPSLQGSTNDIRFPPRMTKTVSFSSIGRQSTFGNNSNNNNNNNNNSAIINENPNFDQYHRMSPMVFSIRERLQKMEKIHNQQRDHEYEPIGEPQVEEDKKEDVTMKNDELDGDKKLLKTTTDDNADNVSAQDFQDSLENRFFKHEIEPITDNKAKDSIHQENTFDEAVIIDESPVKREIPKKRNFMSSAQETGKNLQKRMKASAGALKSSINNKIKRKEKPKEATVSVKVTQYDENEEMPTAMTNDDSQQNDVEEVTPTKSKFNFTMPKIKKISLPERPNLKINERFTKIRQLGRSKSMKDESTTADSTSVTTPEVMSAEPSKKKFDFGTYPRLIRDKFKRSKLPMERSDMSVRSDTPPTSNFTNEQFAKRGPVASRWPEFEQQRQSGQYQQFASESSDYDRETSIERRMRMDFDRTTEEREDFAIVARLISEEQRQMNEMEKENQEIHLMAKQERYKKPSIPARQESSDVASDEWSGMLNRDVSEAEFELQQNALTIDSDYIAGGDINRSFTPQTNQETQSSGSSGHRRRIAMGFDDDDEDYFLRDNNRKLSHEIDGDIHGTDVNSLEQIGQQGFENQQTFIPDKPIRSLKRKNNKKNDVNDDEYLDKTFTPNRPDRKSKQSESDFGNEHDIDEEIDLDFRVQVDDEDFDDEIPQREMFDYRNSLKGLEHPDLLLEREDFDNDFNGHISNLPVPPTPPRRRKKKVRNLNRPVNNNFHHDEVVLQSKNIMGNNNVNVYRSEPHIAPIVQEEHFTTPTPTPRTRSRSNFSSRTLDDALSFQRDSYEAFNLHDNKENDYAQVRKDFPSCPVRRKRSTKSLGDSQFGSMPHYRKAMEDGDETLPPPRPNRNYSTIPNRPPRRKSAGSLVEISKTDKIDDDDYEEIMGNDRDANNTVSERLISGDIVNKMKDRPLPPPPRPKRENRKSKKFDFDDENDENENDKFDKDDGAEKLINETMLTVETEFNNESEMIGDFQEDQIREAREYLPRQESELSEEGEKIIEFEVSTQTDPVPDDEYLDEEYNLTDEKIKTLEDILKEEQEAEMERARWIRQLEEAENLSRGIERFRESNQRSFSEKSRTSGGRSRSTSRPITPSAIVVEHRKSSPIIADNVQQTLTEAGLFVHPITYDDFGLKLEDEEPEIVDEEQEIIEPEVVSSLEEITDVNNNFEDENILDEVDNAEVIEGISIENLDKEIEETFERISAEVLEKERETEQQNIKSVIADDEFDAEMQKKIEDMIESVMSSAREEVDWIREREREDVNDEIVEEIQSKLSNAINENQQTNIELEDEEQKQDEVKEAQVKVIEREVIKPFEEFQPFEDFKPISPSPDIVEERVEQQVEDEVEKVLQPISFVEDNKIEEVSQQQEPPQPPPRKKSATIEEEIIKLDLPQIQQMPKIEETSHQPNSIEKEDVKNVIEQSSQRTPSRLHFDTLEIDNLSVSSIQAGRISASEIDTHTITASEFEAKLTNLPLQNSQPQQPTFEFPSSLIDEIVERVRSVNQTHQEPSQTEQAPPVRPPLPQEYTTIPQSFYQLRDPSDNETAQKSPPRRRRHHRNLSTSEEEYQREQRIKNRTSGSNQPSVASLGGQFLSACGQALREQGNHLMDTLRASSKDENKRDLHVALLILIVIVAGLFLMSFDDKQVHHHHWDFFFPPDNQSR